MEGNVYICGWKSNDDGYSIWVKDHPKLRGQGKTIQDASDALVDAICLALGDGEAVIELDPPLPPSEAEDRFSEPELYLIGGNSRFEIAGPACAPGEGLPEYEQRAKWRDSFFKAPVCRTCGAATSQRSDRPLPVKHVSPGFDGAFGGIGRFSSSGHLQIFSDTFLSLLTDSERARLVFRPVETARQGIKLLRRSRFHELVGPDGPRPVTSPGLNVSGWRCDACGYRMFGHFMEELRMHDFVAREDLSDPLPTLFTIGLQPEVQLCATGRRWREMVGRKGTRGFTSQRLGVIPSTEAVLREPPLPVPCQSVQEEEERMWRSFRASPF